MGNDLEATRRIEPRRQFAGQSFVLVEAVLACGPDGLLVETLGVQLPAFQARNLGGDERRAVCEVRRAQRGPLLELVMVGGQGRFVLGPFRSRCCVAQRGPRERGVQLILRLIEESWRHEKRSRVCCCRNGSNVVACEETRLELADPVPAGGVRQSRIFRKVLLEPALVELGIVERTELLSKAAQGENQSEECGGDVEDKTEPELAREVEPSLGLALHVSEGVTDEEAAEQQEVAVVTDPGEVAELVARVDCAPYQTQARANGLRPGRNAAREQHADAGLEAMQLSALHQV